MKIACIGGGPAGLYLGILVKRVAPEHDVVVYERNRPTDTFGFGVVFSDATLGHLAAADPESHAQITARFSRWDDIAVHINGETLRSTGHGFCGIERKVILEILQRRARELGVRLEFEHAVTSLDAPELRDADVIVACDGVGSWVRDALAATLLPSVDVRPNRFAWLGCTLTYDAFTFLFEQTKFGLFRVHAYPFTSDRSTFIVECRDETWRAAGLDTADEDQTIAILESIFASHLKGARLIKNRSIWRNFPTVRCGKWHADNVVLVGDAAHTAHFSIGSGTKLAMEDTIALRDELLASPNDIPRALAAYEAKRRPEVESLQAAAQASLEWFEGTERYMRMPPVQFTYSLMTRSLRVSHASVGKRDPHLATGVEELLAASTGSARDDARHIPRPTALPWTIGDRTSRSRIAVAPENPQPTVEPLRVITARDSSPWLAAVGRADWQTFDDLLVAIGGAASAGAGFVVSPTLTCESLATDDAVVAWQRVIDFVHRKQALIVARLLVHGEMADDTTPGAKALASAVERLAYADFDVLLLDPARDEMAPGKTGVPSSIEALPAIVTAARRRWRIGGVIATVVADRAVARSIVVAQSAQLVRAGVDLLWVSADDAARDGMRLPSAPLADRLRNELRIPVAVEGTATAKLDDLDAAIAAGRADFVVVPRMP